MKYYIYISDTKVDMLYPQIPKPLLKQIASSLSIDLKLLGAEVNIGAKGSPSDKTRYAKVKIVSEYIEKHMDVGSVDAPSTYFKGTLSMMWGPLTTDETVVYFTGLTGLIGRTVLGLGGSMHHIIGRNLGQPISTPSMSPLLFLWDALRIAEEDTYRNSPNQPINPRLFAHPIDLLGHLTLSMLDINKPFRPPQQLEFLAKTLIQGPFSPGFERFQYGLLGSPIYVAVAD